MVRRLLLCILASTSAQAVETVRIHIADMSGDVQIQGENLSYGPDAEEGTFTPMESSASVGIGNGQLLLNGRLVGEAVRFRSSDARLSALGKQLRGEVVVLLSKTSLQLINVLPLEEYLVAVLGSEMPTSFPLEALKAQAVAARTYALRKKLEGYGGAYHLGNSVLHQVYGGLLREDARTRAAVEATSGQVLTFELQPIEAYFHASCGGKTESGLSALGRNLPYLVSVSCPCGRGTTAHWSLELAASEIRSVLGSKDTHHVRVSGRTPTGRATRVESGGGSLDAVTFRRKLGYDRLKSLSFDVEPEKGGRLRIVGRGYGHGAGMCQWGAKALAEQGRDYQWILSHYYPGVELQQIY